MSNNVNAVVTENDISTKEFLAKVEEAARNGAMQGSKGGRREININEDDMEFGDVEHGLLGIGKITMTPEEQKEIQKEARKKMNEKLEEQKTAEVADRFAKMPVWEIYQPMIDKVTSGYSLNVEME